MKRKKGNTRKVGRSWRRREREWRKGVKKRRMGRRESAGFKPQLFFVWEGNRQNIGRTKGRS